MDFSAEKQFLALRARRGSTAGEPIDRARHLFWRAFQRGELSEAEFTRTVERLEAQPPAVLDGAWPAAGERAIDGAPDRPTAEP
jgi:hypothetical protein